MNIMKGSVIMKKIHSVILVVSIIISFSAAVLLTRNFNEKSEPETAVSLNCYRTPEEAVETELKVQDYKLLERNGTYIALCDSSVSDYGAQYIVNNGQGWQIVTDSVIRNLVFDAVENTGKYYIYIYQYSDKYMIYVEQQFLSFNKNGELDVKDSLDSAIAQEKNVGWIEESFLDSEFAQGQDISSFETYYWYWCIDEMPDDYTIKINDEIVFENGK